MIEEQIYRITRSEQWHLDHPGVLSPVYTHMKTEQKQGRECYRFNFPNILNRYTVGILKESRFTEIPFHYHTDMEMNYVCSGSCTFIMNNREITLNEGDICILDADVVHHAAHKGENDIIFNIVFKKEFFKAKFVNWVGSPGILGEFILSAISKSHQYDRYLVFHTHMQQQGQLVSQQLKQILDLLIQEHYYPSLYSGDLMEHYLSAIFLLLISSVAVGADEYFSNNEQSQIVIKTLKYIEENYHRDSCRLSEIAEQLHFSQSHLYLLVKKRTGSSFSQLKIKQQMERAALLLKTTDIPILGVAEEVGCKNRTFFYNKFKELYGLTPHQYREKEVLQ